MLLWAGSGLAAETSVFDMSLAELMALEVESSRRSEEQFSVPAAIYIITQEDIRRSGSTSITELLRMVPGMHVGQLNGNMFAINSRGTNRRYSRELLVMIDGRTVFNQLNNGVYWARVDAMLADIDHIEVIRGPGGSLWGSNAAQGIVNIITKRPPETVGGYAEGAAGGGGSFANSLAGRLGYGDEQFAARLYAKNKRIMASTNPDSEEQSTPGAFLPGSTGHDGHDFSQAGFRSSWQANDRDFFNLQGDFFDSKEEQSRIVFGSVTEDTEKGRGGNILLRHDHQFSQHSTSSLQLYYDYTYLANSSFNDTRNTYDMDFQHSFSLPAQRVIWGLGYRYLQDKSETPGTGFALDPAHRNDDTYSAFIQDEFSVLDDALKLTIGTKYEHNKYTDDEWQPSGQILYQLEQEHVVWVSASRAVIVPSRSQSDGIVDLGFMVIPINEPGASSNVIYSLECGHRLKFSDNFMLDHSIFWDDHHNRNNDSEQLRYIYGYESVVRYYYGQGRTEVSYTWHRAASAKEGAYENEQIPTNSFTVRNLYNIRHNLEFDLRLFYVDQTSTTSSYSRLDLRLGYYPVEQVELSLALSNAFDPEHDEAISDPTKGNTDCLRQLIVKLSFDY